MNEESQPKDIFTTPTIDDLLCADGAIFSPDRQYRYLLSRHFLTGEGVCLFCMCNPSTADEVKNDPSVTRCIDYARRWGYKTLLVANIFAFRATDPRELTHVEPVGMYNDFWLWAAALHSAFRVVAWGAWGAYRDRGLHVLQDALRPPMEIYCLGETVKGQPRHPLYLRADVAPRIYHREGRQCKP